MTASHGRNKYTGNKLGCFGYQTIQTKDSKKLEFSQESPKALGGWSSLSEEELVS